MPKASPHSLGAAAALALLVYALVLVAGPLVHHGGGCSVPSAAHCALCAATEAVSQAAADALPPVGDPADAGLIAPVSLPRGGAILLCLAEGRAPPATRRVSRRVEA